MEVETIWQIPGIAHFCFLFREAYKLPEFTYEELETALVSSKNKESKIEEVLEPQYRGVGLREYTNIVDKGFFNNPTYLTNEPKDVLTRLICVLLRGCFNTDINLYNWEEYLVKIFGSADENHTSPFYEKRVDNEGKIYDHFIPFDEQTIENKAQILYDLCEYRLYVKQRPQKIDELEEDELRVEPIGQDVDGCLYWYFYGTRLYKENPKLVKKIEEKKIKINRLKKMELRNLSILKKSKLMNKKNDSLSSNLSKVDMNNLDNTFDLSIKQEKEDIKLVKPEILLEELKEAWCCICKTEQDWINLTEKFKNSRIQSEKKLFDVLNDNFLPNMHQLFLKIERTNQKKLQFLSQRNSCRLMMKRFQQEEEERLKESEKQNDRENRARRRNLN